MSARHTTWIVVTSTTFPEDVGLPLDEQEPDVSVFGPFESYEQADRWITYTQQNEVFGPENLTKYLVMPGPQNPLDVLRDHKPNNPLDALRLAGMGHD